MGLDHSSVGRQVLVRSCLAVCAVVGGVGADVLGRGPAGAAQPASSSAPVATPTIVFTDVTRAAGIDFVETIGDDEMSNIVEATGVGCGFLDYDGDGWLDIYLVNGCWLAGVSDSRLDESRRKVLAEATDRLYRNRGDGTFEDVTRKAGITQGGYGMGVVVADYDGDGDSDIYVTNHGPNFLYRNNGDGTFAEVAKDAGVDDPLFSVGAVFLDYDRDGWLDLYVGNYVTYKADAQRGAATPEVRSPLVYEGQQDHLYHNNGNGTFAEVTRKAGLEIRPVGRAMGVGMLDYDADGWVDVFVSNDAMENFLWRNKGDGTFENQALLAGVAFSETGDAAAAMAAEVGDYDGDGRFDILVPDMNMSCLYHNLGGGMFDDLSVRSGIGPAMKQYHGWGAVLADFDLDADLDAYIACGSACRLEAMPDAVLANDGRGRFVPISDQKTTTELAASGRRTAFVSRGVAQADFDNDGDVDLLVANLNDRPCLLRNDTPRDGRHWLEVQLVGRDGNRDAIGAIVKVVAGGRSIVRQKASGGSYLSQHEPRLHFGVGEAAKVDRVEVAWPDGSSQVLREVAVDERITVRQQGRPRSEVRRGSESRPTPSGN